jgi:uncharacterized membrane protein YbhN (UPF0104 family)
VSVSAYDSGSVAPPGGRQNPAVGQLLDAFESFAEHLGAVEWTAVALALICHVGKLVARTRAWRNILAASYPDSVVRWRSMLGAYVAGMGVNALLPVRGGDVLKLYLVKHRVEGSSYPTLAATLLVETLFDMVVAAALLVWALELGVLPGLDIIPRLPAIDWLWLFQYPRAAAAVGVAALLFGFVLGLWAARRIEDFRRRVAQGFAIMRSPSRYLRQVVAWQALDWGLRLLTIWFFLDAFGITRTVENTLLVQVTQSLSTILPLTPAGIGTEQALLVYVLDGEASAGALLSFSVGMKVALISFNVALGGIAIAVMLRTLHWRTLIERDAARPS